VIDRAGGDKRIGVCLDSCHMFATGFDITTADKISEVVDRFAGTVVATVARVSAWTLSPPTARRRGPQEPVGLGCG
jgi:endonuclease IV